MVNPVLVWTAADYEGIDEYVSFEELASNMSWGQFWSVISEVRHVCGSGQVTFKPRADIEFGDSAVLSSVTDVYNLWQQVDASKQGTVNEEAAAAEVTASDATAAEGTVSKETAALLAAAAAALLAAAEASSVSVTRLASVSEPQGAARQNAQQVAAQGTAVDAALQEQEHTDSSNSGPGAAANGVREDQQQLEYLLNCERIYVLQTRTAAVEESTALWHMASVVRIVKAWADRQLIQQEIAALQARIATLQGSQGQR